MKTRTGFVSNSSTTSFTVYGVRIETSDDFKKIMSSMDIPNEHNNEETLWDLSEILEDIISIKRKEGVLKNFFVYHGDPNGETVIYIGKDPSDCPNEMTMGDFKQEVQTVLKDILKTEDLSFGTYSESYYNG